MVTFQAPIDILGLRRQQFAEDQAAQEQQQAQQQQYQKQIFGALGDIAQIYQQGQEMEAGVKAGEMFGKTFGKQFGLDPGIFNSPEYKSMDTASKYQLHQGIRGNFGSLSQGYNFGQRVGAQQAAPYGAAAAKVAGGQGRMPAPSSVNFDAVP